MMSDSIAFLLSGETGIFLDRKHIIFKVLLSKELENLISINTRCGTI